MEELGPFKSYGELGILGVFLGVFVMIVRHILTANSKSLEKIAESQVESTKAILLSQEKIADKHENALDKQTDALNKLSVAIERRTMQDGDKKSLLQG